MLMVNFLEEIILFSPLSASFRILGELFIVAEVLTCIFDVLT